MKLMKVNGFQSNEINNKYYAAHPSLWTQVHKLIYAAHPSLWTAVMTTSTSGAQRLHSLLGRGETEHRGIHI